MPLSDQPSPNIAKPLIELQVDNAYVREQIDQIQLNLGLMNQKINELIWLTSLLQRGVQVVIPMQPTNYAKASQTADQIMQTTSDYILRTYHLLVSSFNCFSSTVFCFQISTCVTKISLSSPLKVDESQRGRIVILMNSLIRCIGSSY